MRVDDEQNYFNTSSCWTYGQEQWCNMEGRYTFIVADLSHLNTSAAASGTYKYQMSLCFFGIMGTKYVRDEPIKESMDIT